MEIEKELRKPANWQDFERLCCMIWRELWQDPNAKMHGRSGQAQQGVDIWGHNNDSVNISGVQCKRYDKITEKIIDDEIKEALKFKPALEHLTFATTAKRDAGIEEIIRLKDVENRKKGLFGISIMEWEDIVDILEQNPGLLNWYENSIGIGKSNSIQVTFTNGTEEIEIRPKFIEKVYYHKDAYSRKSANKAFETDVPYHPFAVTAKIVIGEINHSFVPIIIRIDNTGLTEIKPISLILSFPEQIRIESTNEQHNIPKLNVYPSGFHIDKSKRIVTFNSARLLPQRGIELPEVFVKPDASLKEFEIDWDFSSESFTKKGTLKVKVNSEITPKYISSTKEKLPDNEIIDDIEEILNNQRKR